MSTLLRQVLQLCLLSCILPCFATPEIRKIEELKDHIRKQAFKIEEESYVIFKGRLSKLKFLNDLDRHVFYDYATHYYYSFKSNNQKVKLELTFADSSRLLAAYKDETLIGKLSKDERKTLELVKDSLARCIHPDMNRKEIVLSLHDEIARLCEYDHGNPENQSCVSAILHGKGACGAYTRCLQLMLGMLDIPNHSIQGHEKFGGPHMWNLVQFENDEWYHVDITWDDTNKNNTPRHTYVGLTDRTINKDHRWKKKGYPKTPVKTRPFTTPEHSGCDDFSAKALEAFGSGSETYCAYLTPDESATTRKEIRQSIKRKIEENLQKPVTGLVVSATKGKGLIFVSIKPGNEDINEADAD